VNYGVVGDAGRHGYRAQARSAFACADDGGPVFLLWPLRFGYGVEQVRSGLGDGVE
jgi:hypothetical protein